MYMAFFAYVYVHSHQNLTTISVYMKLRYLCCALRYLSVHVLGIIPGTLQNSFCIFFFYAGYTLLCVCVRNNSTSVELLGMNAVKMDGWFIYIRTASFVARLSFDLLVLL